MDKETLLAELKKRIVIGRKCKWAGCITILREDDLTYYCHIHYPMVDDDERKGRLLTKKDAEKFKRKKMKKWSWTRP